MRPRSCASRNLRVVLFLHLTTISPPKVGHESLAAFGFQRQGTARGRYHHRAWAALWRSVPDRSRISARGQKSWTRRPGSSSDQFGASLTCHPLSYVIASSGIESILGPDKGRRTDDAPFSHVPVLQIDAGAPERPALAVEIPADINTGCSVEKTVCLKSPGRNGGLA